MARPRVYRTEEELKSMRRVRAARYAEKNADVLRERRKVKYAKHRDSLLEKNRVRRRQKHAEFRALNPLPAKMTEEQRRESARENCRRCERKKRALNPSAAREKVKKWQAENRSKTLACKRASEAARGKRTPPWSDRAACKIFYVIAVRVSQCTGIPFEVDHEIPLMGKHVSGLHVPTNLRVIPAAANWRKGNRV
jgi:hypothetical protein